MKYCFCLFLSLFWIFILSGFEEEGLSSLLGVLVFCCLLGMVGLFSGREKRARTIFEALLDAYPNREKFLRLYEYKISDIWRSEEQGLVLLGWFQDHFPKLFAYTETLWFCCGCLCAPGGAMFYLLSTVFGTIFFKLVARGWVSGLGFVWLVGLALVIVDAMSSFLSEKASD